MLGYTWALMQHMLGGLRHFVWDMGRGHDLRSVDQMSWGSLILSLLITVLVWYIVASPAGGS
jgi:succinate dehydrogenase / fumarate reductase cytochrome b subunit